MVVPDIFLYILPFLFMALASMSDSRFAVVLYFLGAIASLLGVGFPYLTTATSSNYWFGIMYVGMGIFCAIMAVITLMDFTEQPRGVMGR